jgi:hypothetical protein
LVALCGVVQKAGAGDQPFARGECVHAAGRLGATGPRLGTAVTADRLTQALREPVRLVHLAIAADPAYQVRPLAAPANWASFSIFGAG